MSPTNTGFIRGLNAIPTSSSLVTMINNSSISPTSFKMVIYRIQKDAVGGIVFSKLVDEIISGSSFGNFRGRRVIAFF